MLTLTVPGRGDYHLAYLALDMNGTLALDGSLIEGVADRVRALGECLQIHILTADTLGKMAQVEQAGGVSATWLRSAADKTAFVERVGPAATVAVGNGANDAGMLASAALGIALLGPEGLAREALEAADVLVPDILAALDLLLHPQRLVATWRI